MKTTDQITLGQVAEHLAPPQIAAFEALRIAGFDGTDIAPALLTICAMADIAADAGFDYADQAQMLRKLADRLEHFVAIGGNEVLP